MPPEDSKEWIELRVTETVDTPNQDRLSGISQHVRSSSISGCSARSAGRSHSWPQWFRLGDD
jgi:hypothetical protein